MIAIPSYWVPQGCARRSRRYSRIAEFVPGAELVEGFAVFDPLGTEPRVETRPTALAGRDQLVVVPKPTAELLHLTATALHALTPASRDERGARRLSARAGRPRPTL